MVRRLLCCVLVTVGLACAPAAGAATVSPSVSSSRPVAVAVDSDGTTYVGFASGGALVRLDAAGRRLRPVVLDRSGPVTALAVSPDDRVWVSYGDGVSAFDPDGTLLRHLPSASVVECPVDQAHHPDRYGGLAVTSTTVYVAGRCQDTLEVYTRSGALLATVTLPPGGFPRGVAWMRAQARPRKPARVFVAMPDRGQVLVYDASTLRTGSQPLRTLTMTRPAGGVAPVPSGVAADEFGSLAVADVANHRVVLYDVDNDLRPFRTLGHPPRAGSGDGAVNYPAAIAQHAQDGGGLAGNLVVADMRNGRVQRWDSGGGYTFWARAVQAPAGAVPDPDDPDPGPDPEEPSTDGAPVPTTRPRVVGEAEPGSSVSCSAGRWSGSPTSFGFRWLRDAVVGPGATGSTYVVTGDDLGAELTCRVTAGNAVGSASATSDPVFVGDPVAPALLSAPTVSGILEPGATLTCSTGTWSGHPSYSFVWLRGSVQVGTTPSYVVAAADAGRRLTCTVIAASAGGARSATTAPVTIAGDGTEPPEPTEPTGPTPEARVLIDDGAAWTGSTQVTLRIVAPVDATGVVVSNTADFAVSSTRGLTASTLQLRWALVPPAHDGAPASVHVRWVGGASDGEVVSDSIRVDRTGPVIGSASVVFRDRAWRLRVQAEDSVGVARLQHAASTVSGRRHTVAFRPEVRVDQPAVARWVRAIDRFGNVGAWVRVRL